uniref:WASH complex subunit 3 n=2 Tax=Corvus moneduloides TaxID=1196302 RepID=A0A8C3DD90_CORMO
MAGAPQRLSPRATQSGYQRRHPRSSGFILGVHPWAGNENSGPGLRFPGGSAGSGRAPPRGARGLFPGRGCGVRPCCGAGLRPPRPVGMDEDGLPIVGSDIDLTKVPAIQQKRTVAFLNQFVVHTVQFLNRFSTVCEEKLSALSLRIQQIETTLNILDAKLSSIPGLEDVKFEVSSANVNSVTNGPVAQAAADQQTAVSPQSGQNNTQEEGLQKTEVVTENVTTVAKDPRYARYLKMVQVRSEISLSTFLLCTGSSW